MKRRPLLQATVAIPLVGMLPPVWSREFPQNAIPTAFSFGGSKKMTYDVRQRPQAVYFNGKVFIGYKDGGTTANKNPRNVAPTHASLVSYDPESRTFSKALTFGKQTSDHHDCPVLRTSKASITPTVAAVSSTGFPKIRATAGACIAISRLMQRNTPVGHLIMSSR